MSTSTLTLLELNRATLARQLLLERSALPVLATIERLVGLQAQLALPPYVGLWTRLQAFQRDDLASLIENRSVVKATLMRATLHLFTADDYLLLRATLQPALTHVAESLTKRRDSTGLDFDKLFATVREYVAEEPRTFAEISDMLANLLPDQDVGVMRYTARTHIPLIQVPTNDGWSYSAKPRFTLAESWLGKPIPDSENLRTLIFRYLAAFGPATATDMQTWSGFTGLKDAFQKLKPELASYRDEQRRELFDLPDVSLPAADTPASVRFLPEFDNLLLAHDKRTRVLADAYRPRVYLPGLRVAATFLVGGFVGGVWRTEKKKSAAVLIIEPFEPLTKQNRAALTEEAERLIRFVEASAKTFEVRFVE